jgi:peptidoglycan/LPS O-acetylase OafA/YrhL
MRPDDDHPATATITPPETSIAAVSETSVPAAASAEPDRVDHDRARLGGLDGLRGIALIAVLFGHFGQLDMAGGLFDRVIRNGGGFGVVLFFVLSGFLITHLLLREEANRGAISLAKFYARRAVRILPPLFLYLAGLLGLTLLGVVAVPMEDLLAGVFFVRNYLGSATGESAHLWSLSVEEQFYLAWPFLLVLLGMRWRIVLVAAAVVVLPVWMDLVYRFAESHAAVNFFRTDLRLFPLMVGVLLALTWSSRTGRKYLTAPLLTSTWVASVTVVILGLAVFTGVRDVPIIRSFIPLVVCFGFALIINHCVNRRDSWVCWVLEISVVAWLGRLSYSVYLWQQLFCGFEGPPTWFREFPVNLTGAFLCGIFSYYVVEQPLLRLRDRLRWTHEGTARRKDRSLHELAAVKT